MTIESNSQKEVFLNKLDPSFVQSDWKKKSPFHLNRECWQVKNSSKNTQIIKIQHIKLSAFQNFLQFLNEIFPFDFDVKVTVFTKTVKFEEKCDLLNMDEKTLNTIVNQGNFKTIENTLLDYIKTHRVSQKVFNPDSSTQTTSPSTEKKILTAAPVLLNTFPPADNLSNKTFKLLPQASDEMKKEGKKTPFEEKYHKEWDSLENDLLQLNNQLEDLEIGRVDLSLTHYSKTLGNLPQIIAIYEQVKDQGDLSALKEIDATLKQMDWAREDFMELWTKESEAEIQEASLQAEEALKTFLNGPDPHLNYVDSYRHLKQAILQLRTLKEMHRRSLVEIRQLNKILDELSLQLPEKQSWTSYLVSVVKGVNTTIRHPIQSFQEALSFKEEEKIATLQENIANLNHAIRTQTKKDSETLSEDLEKHLQDLSSTFESYEQNLEGWETLFFEQATLLGFEESELSKLLEAPFDIPKSKAISVEKQKREKLYEKKIRELKSLEKGTPAWKVQAWAIFFLALEAGIAYRILHNVQAQGALVRAAKWNWESKENLKISNEHETEAAFLAITLDDRQDFVTMSDDRFDAYTKRYPEVKEILVAYRTGAIPLPEKGEIDAIKDAYLYSHFPQSPPDLPDIQPKTLSEWLELFFTPQEEASIPSVFNQPLESPKGSPNSVAKNQGINDPSISPLMEKQVYYPDNVGDLENKISEIAEESLKIYEELTQDTYEQDSPNNLHAIANKKLSPEDLSSYALYIDTLDLNNPLDAAKMLETINGEFNWNSYEQNRERYINKQMKNASRKIHPDKCPPSMKEVCHNLSQKLVKATTLLEGANHSSLSFSKLKDCIGKDDETSQSLATVELQKLLKEDTFEIGELWRTCLDNEDQISQSLIKQMYDYFLRSDLGAAIAISRQCIRKNNPACKSILEKIVQEPSIQRFSDDSIKEEFYTFLMGCLGDENPDSQFVVQQGFHKLASIDAEMAKDFAISCLSKRDPASQHVAKIAYEELSKYSAHEARLFKSFQQGSGW